LKTENLDAPKLAGFVDSKLAYIKNIGRLRIGYKFKNDGQIVGQIWQSVSKLIFLNMSENNSLKGHD